LLIQVEKVAELCGSDRIVECLDVSTQSEHIMTLAGWAKYYNEPVKTKIYNVITLEIGDTPLGQLVKRPKIVRDLDWFDQMWDKDTSLEDYPRVQLYCLMGPSGCYTDFHIDFGGTSVFYHILKGRPYLIQAKRSFIL
jgi:hypothetical protein